MDRNYNLQKDPQDNRDMLIGAQRVKALKLPPSYDLRSNCPPVWDQGKQGSCTSHAGCACRSMLANDPELDLSRAFLYYQERVLGGKEKEDSGATMRDICKATQKFGICHTELMPYQQSDYKTAPTEQALLDALPLRISAYKRLAGLDIVNVVKQALVSRGQPVLTGMDVYESMDTEKVAETGVLPMPRKGESILGGHAVLIVGYEDCKTGLFARLRQCIFGGCADGYFIVRNSWGGSWGKEGYFMMPYDFLKKYAYDLWIME